jgi:ribonuclease BN (tRNA processing enzyme)
MLNKVLIVLLLLISSRWVYIEREYSTLLIEYKSISDSINKQNTAIEDIEAFNIDDSIEIYNNILTTNRDIKIQSINTSKEGMLTLIEKELKVFSNE